MLRDTGDSLWSITGHASFMVPAVVQHTCQWLVGPGDKRCGAEFPCYFARNAKYCPAHRKAAAARSTAKSNARRKRAQR